MTLTAAEKTTISDQQICDSGESKQGTNNSAAAFATE